MPFGSPQISVSVTAAGREVDAHEVQRRGRDALPAERARVALAAFAVVEEPRRAEREHRVPAVGLTGERAVPARERVVEREAARRPTARGTASTCRRRTRRRRRPRGARSTVRAASHRATISSVVRVEHEQLGRPRVRAPPGRGPGARRRSPSSRDDRRARRRSCCTADGAAARATRARVRSGASRCAWLPNTTYSEPFACAARPPGQVGPPGRSSDRASVSSVIGSMRSTHEIASGPTVWRSRKTSPGSRSTTIVAAIASRERDLGPTRRRRRVPSRGPGAAGGAGRRPPPASGEGQ